MTKQLELVHGTGNVFHDLGHPNADIEQMKSIIAAQIIATLDDRGLSVRAAQDVTGFTAADFSRIRRAKLDRFTIDRLVAILNRLDRRVEVSVSLQSRRKTATSPAPAAR